MKKIIPLLIALLICSVPSNAQNMSNKTKKLFDQTVQYITEGKNAEAIKGLTRLIKKYPNGHGLYAARASCYVNLHEYEKGLADFNQAIMMYRFEPTYFYNRSRCYYLMNDYQKAINDIDKALEIDKDHEHWAPNMIQKGYCEMKMNDTALSMKLFRDVYKKDSNDLQALNSIGLLLLYEDSAALAYTYFERAYKLDTSYTTSKHNMAFCSLYLGEYQRCIDLVNSDLGHFQFESYAINNRGYAKMKLGDLDGAQKDFDDALKLDPTNSYVIRNMGLLASARGDKAKACELLQKALDMGFTREFGNECQNDLNRLCGSN